MKIPSPEPRAPNPDPQVSVIIPTFNRIEYLRRALALVEAQTFRDFELLVLDDGSTDGTREFLAGYTPDFPFRWLAFDRCERSHLRNTGAREARGEYIAFLDDDDEWLPAKLEQQVDYLSQHPTAGLVYARTVVVNHEGVVDRRATAIHRRLYNDQARRGHRYADLAYHCVMFTSSVMVRRAVFFAAGGYDERYVEKEDLDLYLRISLVARIACVGAEPLVRYRVHEGGSAARLGEARVAVSKAHLRAIARDPGRDPDGAARRGLLFNIAKFHLYARRHRAALDALRTLCKESPSFLLRRYDWPTIGRILVKGALLGWREEDGPRQDRERRGLEGTLDGHVERIDPLDVPPGILSLHQVRYEFAKPFCAGGTALDVACGAGYGTDLLAGPARYAIGLDLDEAAIGFARKQYARPGLRYLVGDAQALPFAARSFDVVISFETIEHLPDIDRYLREVQRLLTPGGTYIVSTPKVRRTTHRPKNPHHTVEYSVEDFRRVLETHFADVELYGQVRVQSRMHRWLQRADVLGVRHYIPGRMRRRIDRQLGTAPFEEMSLSDQKVVKGALRRAADMIAVCRGPRDSA